MIKFEIDRERHRIACGPEVWDKAMISVERDDYFKYDIANVRQVRKFMQEVKAKHCFEIEQVFSVNKRIRCYRMVLLVQEADAAFHARLRFDLKIAKDLVPADAYI